MESTSIISSSASKVSLIIAESWLKKQLGSCASIKARIGWQGLTTKEYLNSGDYYLITGTDFLDGRIDWKNCHYVTKDRFDQDPHIKIQKGDVLVSKDGTIGKVAYLDEIPGPGTLNSGVFVIRSKDKQVSQRYLAKVFVSKYFDDFIDSIVAGSTIVHLYQKDIVNFSFLVPPTIEEQDKIADVLESIDNLVVRLDEAIAKKRQIKEGLMQQLLTGKTRLPGFNDEWKDYSLGEFSQIVMGQSPSSSYYNDKGEGLPLIQGNADLRNRKSFIRIYTSMITKTCEAGDIIMSVRAPVGAVGRASYKSCLGRGVCAIKASSDFLYHYLVYNENNWGQYSKGSTFDSINGDDLKAVVLNAPQSIEEQNAIASILSNCETELFQLESKRDKYCLIKQGMMQELLTGKTRLI